MIQIYAMYYTGVSGSGHAVFVMKDGVITGADPIGGVLDGLYSTTEDGYLDVSVQLKLPAGTWLVTGSTVGSQGVTQEIKAKLPADLGGGNPVAVDTPTGPVNVVFRHLRTIE